MWGEKPAVLFYHTAKPHLPPEMLETLVVGLKAPLEAPDAVANVLCRDSAAKEKDAAGGWDTYWVPPARGPVARTLFTAQPIKLKRPEDAKSCLSRRYATFISNCSAESRVM